MGLAVGIVGLPNVGKSTTFNALTKVQNAESANYGNNLGGSPRVRQSRRDLYRGLSSKDSDVGDDGDDNDGTNCSAALS